MRPLGVPTRGTTNPNRLRRLDNWIAWRCGRLLRDADEPLVVDLGYGASPVTTVELRNRLATIRPDLRVVGLEIDPARVERAQWAADPPGLTFARGGFELAGLRPRLVRAMNVLRQYDPGAVRSAWRIMAAASDLVIDGTCDELGRVASWILLDQRGPISLTLAARLSTLDSPATLAERLPKALIHHNVAGAPIHQVLGILSQGWRDAAPLATFGVRQRWLAAVGRLTESGAPVLDDAHRWRLGEVTLPWSAVAPGD